MITIKSISGRELYVSDSASDVRTALQEASRTGADLRGAYLTGAYLTGADLTGADLRGADLRGAYLTGADLTGAYLTGADLRGAYLTGAYLTGADLTGADLRGADLRGAYLTGADLTGAKNAEVVMAQLRILPEGDLIGWKKARGQAIVKLSIPNGARRSNATGRKCRAESATVLAVYNQAGDNIEEAVSGYDSRLIYRVGETVTPNNGFEEDPLKECAPGIHFFITREEAEQWTV